MPPVTYRPIDHANGEKYVPWNSVPVMINGRREWLYSVVITGKSVQLFHYAFQAKPDPETHLEPSNYVTFDIREVFGDSFPNDREWTRRWLGRDTRRMLAAVGKMLEAPGMAMPEWRDK